MTGDDFDPTSPLTIAPSGARPVNRWRRKVSLRGTGLRQVAEYLAQNFASLLGLESCVLYVYDRRRANLEAVATVGGVAGNRRPHRISLDPGTSLAALAATPGEPGGLISLPLWDSRRLLGVVSGRMGAGQVPDPVRVNLARAMAKGGSLALSMAIAAESHLTRTAKARVAPSQGMAGEFLLNPHLTRHLEAAFRRTRPGGPVALALLRLSGPGCRGRLPYRGGSIPALGSGRGFGFGADSNRVALVWLGERREDVLETLEQLTSGRIPLGRVTGAPIANLGPGPAAAWTGTWSRCATDAHVSAAALLGYPEDLVEAGSMLSAASDLLDLQTYLQATPRDEGRVSVYPLTGDSTAMVMESHVLAQEIDRQRQVLKDAIASGRDFQDKQVREISERLDRLIVVMMRFMGHRGAVP